ncbi:Major facilitator superfamily domain, general substrate transporter [Metarhizium album ARSEF 1941]|uniref:Probable transporter MCH1 n=1 Tax=Metarhizium album (strain ARSEF 1941) TaxID=1081103 RepID=A0A0B2WFR2_METAS|nr:Major facilitator superfamily domain, general substrate transporter [Metarhizium album ARSEF 1941]KHN94761.1 Major facilitator superfamily domain, general substrate transporter [Metarhizium album ARSEF 1941]
MPTSLAPDDLGRVAPTPVAGVMDGEAPSTVSACDDDDSFDQESARRSRLIRQKQVVRVVSLIFATFAALCAGSIVVFSLYAPRFQSRLRYTQFQVNGVAIAGSVALYLPISVMGYVCDRVGVAPLSLLSAVLFGTGYGTAAAIYRKLDIEYNAIGKPHGAGNEWSYPAMIFAFVCVGTATCSMYMASVSTCAKNFGKGKYRGLALAMPIAGFGLSGMWLSQFASRFLYETAPDGSRGDVDVFRFFLFLAILLSVVGFLGCFLLRVVDEEDLIEEAIEELEASGLLNGSSLLDRSQQGYGSAGAGSGAGAVTDRADMETRSLLDSSKDGDAQWKKNRVLNAETHRFLTDRTMWPFALSFLLMIGPGEAFINNLGTVIGTLTPPATEGFGETTSAATHVSIFGVTSTVARLLIGTLTDLLAPAPDTQHIQISPSHPRSSQRSSAATRFTISRVAFVLFFAGLMSIGFIFLASGAVQNHADRFWVVSGLVGAGYGAIFSLTPLIVTIIWGVENFATNFGIIAMLPALGSTFWGLVYSGIYQAGAKRSTPPSDGTGSDHLFCHGKRCYSATFWAKGICVWVACLLVLFAWKGRGGWKERGIVI